MIFDTDCILCSRWIHFLLRHEANHRIIFTSARSDKGLALAASHGLSRAALDKSYLVIVDSRPFLRSDAGLALLTQLRAPSRWLRVLGIMPRPVCDWIYALVARNRFKWFGRSERCFLPPPEASTRFIDH
jgi:predicted DCC family thiol-disulfide oxidoreductase YuxK